MQIISRRQHRLSSSLWRLGIDLPVFYLNEVDLKIFAQNVFGSVPFCNMEAGVEVLQFGEEGRIDEADADRWGQCSAELRRFQLLLVVSGPAAEAAEGRRRLP